MGGGGSALSEVRRDSDEYGGGGPLEYIEEGLTTAVAIGRAEV
jgi:hypothetical protein